MKIFILTAILATLAAAKPQRAANVERAVIPEPANLEDYLHGSKLPAGFGKIVRADGSLDKRDCNYSVAECTSPMGPMPMCTGDSPSKVCCQSDWCDGGYMTCAGAGSGGAGPGGVFGPVNGGKACMCLNVCGQ